MGDHYTLSLSLLHFYSTQSSLSLSLTFSTGIDPGPGVFKVVHRVHDNPDQQMYSCGSLAPKMRRGGCMDSHKPGEPWERVRIEDTCCNDNAGCLMGVIYQWMKSCSTWKELTDHLGEEQLVLTSYELDWSFIIVLGELSGVSGCGDRVSSLLPLCAETLQHRHYPQHINLLETLLKLLLG
ncbi:uncharacterized protein LOC135347382 [Halichondria panicea]|uniref:uncharacterized protein LOC135347382 n=1 Tax=Halichondria panicea TaxID=6063 RepID=UPI00312BB5EE